MSNGKIGVTTENIFPVIKKFLYSDHEIFLREIVANAVDATQKMKALARSGEFKGELGDLKVQVVLDEDAKTLKIIDNGIGMTEEEIDKYINQIAFSSAGEFLEKYKDQIGSIIGHFGLGFYSAFMVSEKVTIETLSWKDGAKAVKWTCDGSPEFTMEDCDKSDRGTVITLYLDKDSEEFAAKGRISQLLSKYCKFMPVPVVFGKKTEWKDGKNVDTDEDNVINNIEPIWTKAPSSLKDEDYDKFYKALYPMEDEPMFHIHLNVDYPFTLTGVLYFPKIKERMAVDKHKIQLYCNQMFVTDHVDNIVPDFLTLLHGVIDSPDIPLNVSRSYLQSDANVKKISTYITKKVADRLEDIFNTERAEYEKKWDNIKLFIEYGMLSEEKFGERGMKFALLKNCDGKYFSLDEYKTAVEPQQTDKDKKVVFLYATKQDEQYSFIEAAKAKGYDVLLMDCELDSHFVNLLEQKMENVRFARVDSDSVENLIPKEEKVKPELSEDDKKAMDELFKAVLPKENDYIIEAENLSENEAPILLTQNEFMRRYREMSALNGGMNFYGTLPESYNVIVNMENPLIKKIWEERNPESGLLKQVVDLALLSNGMLKGKALADFIARSAEILKEK
jgi:molecular chaperone HtpG